MWYFGEMKSKNPTQKTMEEIKSKYGSETLKTKDKKEIASQKLAIIILIFWDAFFNIITPYN